jgi:hypothetical protein
MEPSGQPTNSPTGEPSCQPSAKPSHVPTTSKPTGGQTTLLRQKVDAGMSGVNCSDWNDDYDQILAESIATVSGGSVLQQNVEVLSCTDIENRRRRMTSKRTASRAASLMIERKLQESQSIALRLLIVMVLEESGIDGITRDNAFSVFQAMIDDSVSTGTLQSTLNARLSQEFGTAAPILAVDSVSADPSDGGIDVTRSRSPTSLPTSDGVEAVPVEATVWFVTLMVMLAMILLLGILYIVAKVVYDRRGAKVVVTDIVVDVDDEAVEDDGFVSFKDMNSFQKASSNLVRKPKPEDVERIIGNINAASRSQRQRQGNDNKVFPFEEEYNDFSNIQSIGDSEAAVGSEQCLRVSSIDNDADEFAKLRSVLRN